MFDVLLVASTETETYRREMKLPFPSRGLVVHDGDMTVEIRHLEWMVNESRYIASVVPSGTFESEFQFREAFKELSRFGFRPAA